VKAKKELGEMIDKGIYIKPALVHISSGTYTMGSNSGESDEKPPHQVTISYDFEIGKYEVSNQEFVKFLNDVVSVESKWFEDKSQNDNSHIIKSGSSYSVESDYETHPVIEVSWFGAKAYAKWLSQKIGRNYRLPTEAEWEFVARAGTQSKWSFGDSKSDLKDYAWYAENAYDKGEAHNYYGIHQVGTKKSNQWGVYDMYGNVWEWCEDWYLEGYKSSSLNGSVNQPQNKNKKVLRGASWVYDADHTRSAYRNTYFPTFRNYNIGFRLQRTLP